MVQLELHLGFNSLLFKIVHQVFFRSEVHGTWNEAPDLWSFSIRRTKLVFFSSLLAGLEGCLSAGSWFSLNVSFKAALRTREAPS